MTITTFEALRDVPVDTRLRQTFHGTTNEWQRVPEGLRLLSTGVSVNLGVFDPMADGNTFEIVDTSEPAPTPVVVGQVRMAGTRPMLVTYIDNERNLVHCLALQGGYLATFAVSSVMTGWRVEEGALTLTPENLRDLARNQGSRTASHLRVERNLNRLLSEREDSDDVEVGEVIEAVGEEFDVTRPEQEIEIRVQFSGYSNVEPSVSDSDITPYDSITIDEVETVRVDWSGSTSFMVTVSSGNCACEDVDLNDLVSDYLSNNSYNYEDFTVDGSECDNC